MPSYIEQRDDYWIVGNDLGYGNALVLKSSWSNRYLSLIAKHDVKIIRLNERLGWHDRDVSFLLRIPGIRGVDILSDRVTDISPIFELSELKILSFYCKTKKAGAFARFKNLEDVSLAWRKVYESVFELDSLLRVNILDFPDRDVSRLKRNKDLQELRLESKRLQNLAGVERLSNLIRLDFFRCRILSSINEVASCKSIQKLSFDRCPNVHNLSPISNLCELREFEIEDCGGVQSLTPLCQCKKLKSLRIAGNTHVIDGDFGCLQKLPNLKNVFLVPRKHYSHIAEELERT